MRTADEPKLPRSFEVSAQWMKACGYGDRARTFDVLRTWQEGRLTFVDLNFDGRPWTVIAEWRGRFVD